MTETERLAEIARKLATGMQPTGPPAVAAQPDPNSGDFANAMLPAGPPRESETDIIGRSELAYRLGVSSRTVSRMVDRGELPRPCLSDGGRPRWLWSFVMEFLEKRHRRQCAMERRKETKLGE